MDDEMNRQEFAEYMTAFERRLDDRFGRLDRRLDAMDDRLTAHDGRFGRLDGALGELKHSMTVQFEETRREIKLSLEAVEALGERMDRRFDEFRREQANKAAPLEDAVRHVARQTTRLPKKPRGRRP